MDISEYASASEANRTKLRTARLRRQGDATDDLRQMSEIEIAEMVRGPFPQAAMVRVAIDDGDDVTCGGIGIYDEHGARLHLVDYGQRPCNGWTLNRLIVGAWEHEGGRNAWPEVDGQDEGDYPSGYEVVYEIRLPRLPA
ncbi:hypothetical protein [Micromonospora sp. NPDC005652]|uniref:hypothetical protein n=1 Tax=Micromonospora sp. NPDC005652 TaxID=3157046 RepID=UPI0033DEE1F0